MLFWRPSTPYLIWGIASKGVSLIPANPGLTGTGASARVPVQATLNLHNVSFTVRCQSTKIWSRVALQSSHYIRVRSRMRRGFGVREAKKRGIRRGGGGGGGPGGDTTRWYLKFRWHFSIIPGDPRCLTNMGKRKRKSKQQQSSVFPSPSSPKSITVQGRPQPKKRRPTFPPQISTPAIQPQATSQMDSCPPQVNKKLWNRFYEPLILLLAYGKSQGKRVKTDETSSEEYLDGGNKKTLSKKFLDELAYICDYSPGGDTVAAIAIQDGPHLIYWVAANTSKGSKVKPFLSDILQLLGQVYNASEERVSTLEYQISDRAMVFSAQKLQRYRFMLKRTINTCLSILEGQNGEGRVNFPYSRASLCVTDSLVKH